MVVVPAVVVSSVFAVIVALIVDAGMVVAAAYTVVTD